MQRGEIGSRMMNEARRRIESGVIEAGAKGPYANRLVIGEDWGDECDGQSNPQANVSVGACIPPFQG